MPAILLTRPEPAARAFAQGLAHLRDRAEIVISPLMQTVWTTPAALPAGMPIFTSQNGVQGFMRAGGTAHGPCWCVGPATARAARQAGFDPRLGGGTAEALGNDIIASGDPGPFVHIRGVHARGDLAGRLAQAGCDVAQAIVYDQQPRSLTARAAALLESEKPVILPLFSPRTAAQFAQVHHGPAPLLVAAISPAVATALTGCTTTQIEIAAQPDASEMRNTVERLFDAALRLEGPRAAQ